VVRLVRSKGVGVFFITQNPRDIPADVLGQLGHRVQHALRAFTPDDEKALKSAARTYPKTPFYDVAELLTTLGIGEALVSTLTTNGSPTPPFAVRMVPPSSLMAALPPADMTGLIAASSQVRKYATEVDRESAHEKLEARMHAADAPAEAVADALEAPAARAPRGRAAKAPTSTLETVIGSPVVRAMATQAARTLTRSLLGALLGSPRRR
jgi:hypothetical protein